MEYIISEATIGGLKRQYPHLTEQAIISLFSLGNVVNARRKKEEEIVSRDTFFIKKPFILKVNKKVAEDFDILLESELIPNEKGIYYWRIDDKVEGQKEEKQIVEADAFIVVYVEDSGRLLFASCASEGMAIQFVLERKIHAVYRITASGETTELTLGLKEGRVSLFEK